MFKEQLENIRIKMTISKEYEELVLSVFYSPYANKYGSTFLVNRKFNFDVLNQYLYIIQSHEHTDDLILKIPGSVYTYQELSEISLIVEKANEISAI